MSDLDYRPLIAAVILEAMEEATTVSPTAQALDALLFLTSRDIGAWMEAAGLPFGEPLEVLRQDPAKVRRKIRHFRYYLARRENMTALKEFEA